MKKLAPPLLAFLFSMSLYAQVEDKNFWGITGGLNFPMDDFSIQQAGDNINSMFTSESNSAGWHLGLQSRVYASKQLYFGSNLLYTQTDYLLTQTTDGISQKETFSYSGSQLDVMAGLEIFGFLRGYGGLNGNVNFDQNWNDTFDSFSAGYLFGAGVDLWKLTVDVRYNGSFKDHTGTWNGVPLSYSRSDLMVGVGFKF